MVKRNGRNKLRYNGSDFYGLTVKKEIGELTSQVRHGAIKGIPYSYIVLLDQQGLVKWKIIPRVTHNSRVSKLSLLHRNKWGAKGFHTQNCSEWGTVAGLKSILEYIRRHEVWELAGECQETANAETPTR